MPMLVSWANKGGILNRLKGVFNRATDLRPIGQDVKQLVLDANRERALKGLDFEGNPYAPLRPATIAERRRLGFPPGPPLVRKGAAAAVIAGCQVQVFSQDGQLRLSKSWPEYPWMNFHIEGTSRMAQRNPAGFSLAEMAKARSLLKGHVLGRRSG